MNLKELRINSGLTQAHLAKLLGVTKGYVGLVETGQRTPSKLYELATHHVLQCSVVRLSTSEKRRLNSRRNRIPMEVTE